MYVSYSGKKNWNSLNLVCLSKEPSSLNNGEKNEEILNPADFYVDVPSMYHSLDSGKVIILLLVDEDPEELKFFGPFESEGIAEMFGEWVDDSYQVFSC